SWRQPLRSSSALPAFEQSVIQADLIAIFHHLEAALIQAAQQIGGAIHLAVAICDAGKIEGPLLQAEGGGLAWLTVPQQFQDVERAFGLRGSGRASQDRADLLLREAIEELTHPDGVVTFGQQL